MHANNNAKREPCSQQSQRDNKIRFQSGPDW